MVERPLYKGLTQVRFLTLEPHGGFAMSEPSSLRVHRMTQFIQKMVAHHDAWQALRTIPMNTHEQKLKRELAVTKWHSDDTELWKTARMYAAYPVCNNCDESDRVHLDVTRWRCMRCKSWLDLQEQEAA